MEAEATEGGGGPGSPGPRRAVKPILPCVTNADLGSERKIDLIEERLGGIETLLRNLSPISASKPPTTEAFIRQPSDKLTPLSSNSRDETSSTVFDPEDAGDFEGNSSLAAHTVFASEFLEHAVQGTPLQQQGNIPKIDAALSSLRHILNIQKTQRAVSSFHEFRFPGSKQPPKVNLRDLPLPPMALVAEKLREMKHGPAPMMLAVLYCFIEVERFTDQSPEAKAAYPGTEVMTLWIKHAQIQGRIYERLYSPGALRQSEMYRVEQVGILAAEQKNLMSQSMKLFAEFNASESAEGRMFAIMLKSDEVSYLSSLALTYRAMPPTGTRSRTFSDECIDSARAAMSCHQEAMDMMDDQSLKIVYIHWTILYAPFIPFIVIFCLVIETSSAEDLQRLGDFVQSLAAACDLSHSISKLHQLCQVLYNVAQLYIEAKAQQPLDQDMVPVGNEFNMYLSQLGFMPMEENIANFDVSGTGTIDDQARSMAQTTQLGDWFSGNNYMLGLLEEDLSGINPSGWPS
ncbi:hypothetical protein ABKA04_007645 [Annulohypoxylon sp. FPYF3050]